MTSVLENPSTSTEFKTSMIKTLPASIVHDAIAKNSDSGNKTLQLLLQYGASPTNAACIDIPYFDEVFRGLRTPLTTAFLFQNFAAMEILCKQDINVNHERFLDINLFHVVLNERIKICDVPFRNFCDKVSVLLIQHGADLSLGQHDFGMPLHLASAELVFEMAEAGARHDVNYVTTREVSKYWKSRFTSLRDALTLWNASSKHADVTAALTAF